MEALITANGHHIQTITELQRRLDDIENRGQRNNLHIRGLPELLEGDNLQAKVLQLFQQKLEKPDTFAIAIERVHRALKPKGAATDRPRHIICCLFRFGIKEEILTKARKLKIITFMDSEIIILQDLSWHTLQQCRLIQPLISSLRNKGLLLRWAYPFGVQVTRDGTTVTLTNPEDISHFC